ncbi:hypothetical protein [Natronoglomus mannanivorans]|uniref:Uncharacterized protein n=1 Tax=Natronoglomus mannanivorans TaxID=2979990 RepID=A0AAP3E3Y7_9EURY|nr:hypothetical protein [Halobacteria archaeon AArc-xg1-1]
MGSIILGPPETDGQRLHISISADGLPNLFIEDDFEAIYNDPINGVDDGILMIPAITNLLPIAWATGSSLNTPVVDSDFSQSIDDTRDVFGSMYPDFQSPRLLVADTTTETTIKGDESLLLFSGGVDSLTTYIRNRDEHPRLAAIHGADLRTDNKEGWGKVEQSLQSFADFHGTPLHTVQSNIRDMLSGSLLQSYYRTTINGSWWGGVQHGLALLGLCAPLTQIHGATSLYIAATHTDSFSKPWGSTPESDESLHWGSTRVYHKGHDLTRQDKIETISEYTQETGERPSIRSCYMSDSGDNCGTCEKCCRTIVGLVLAGLHPTDHGYPISDDTFAHARRCLENGSWNIGSDEKYMWENLQNNISDKDEYQENISDFLGWLENADLNEIKQRTDTQPSFVSKAKQNLWVLPEPFFRLLVRAKRSF